VITDAIKTLVEGRDLSAEETHIAMMQVMSGGASPTQISAFLVALRMKGETPDEIAGCARAMRAHVTPARPSRADLVDTCGTGGDGLNTFNISTSAALVAAAAGATVAKHGNRAMSSRTGSADVLEALGVRIDLRPEDVAECIDTVGFGFLFAQAHHPAMKHAAPVRRELATRTVFNVLGPLTNPAGARAQVVGVYAPEMARTIAEALVRLDARRAFVVHGAGGIDELSPAGPNLVCEVADGKVREYELDPEDLGVDRCDPRGLRGADPETNARALRDVLEGEIVEGAHRDAVLLNAAGAIAASGHAADLSEGLALARRTLDSGAAGERLDELIAFSRADVSK
jgi:anthranilate phosphoribosyltransferase